MKTAIVGYTGFVGQNICHSHHFDAYYNSVNIVDAYDTHPDFLVYAGIRSEMFTANNFPEKDLENIKVAIDNIRKINPRRLVLISTISVYPKFEGDENTLLSDMGGSAYGRNRRFLEQWVEENINEHHIIRLPALYGKGIKKNFIFDMINFIPPLLKKQKYEELFVGSELKNLYRDRGDGYYKCIVDNKEDKVRLRSFFENTGFSALNFTDSRSEYQYFNLGNLWDVICNTVAFGIPLLTIATEPIVSSELYEYVYGSPFCNEVMDDYPVEHLRSIHADKFNGKDGFLYSKGQLMSDIKHFIQNEKSYA